MENLALVSSKFPVLVGAPNPAEIPNWPYPPLPLPAAGARGGVGGGRRPRFVASALRDGGDGTSQRILKAVVKKMAMQGFASISSSSNGQMTTSSGMPNSVVPPPPTSNIAPFQKRYAMQQAFNTMMNQTGQFNNAAFSPGSPFPFPAASPSAPASSSPSPAAHVSSEPVGIVDVPSTKMGATPSTVLGNETETKKEPKKYDAYRSPAPVMRMSAFVDVSPEEILQKESTKASAENFYSEKELMKMLMIILLHQILIYTSVSKILFHGS